VKERIAYGPACTYGKYDHFLQCVRRGKIELTRYRIYILSMKVFEPGVWETHLSDVPIAESESLGWESTWIMSVNALSIESLTLIREAKAYTRDH
jgi:hypothetical protein